METLFRSIIVVCGLLTITFWVMPNIDYMWFTNQEIHLLDQGGYGAVIPGNAALYWGTLAGWLILSVGLFFYIKLARTCFVIFYVVNLVLSVFSGIQVLSQYEVLLMSLIGIADGAILTMAYLTSISAKFAHS